MFRNIQTWISAFQTDPVNALISILLMMVALLLSLMLHELGHGFVALRCGDPTAKMMGRLSLDPRKHLDPIGTICMFFLGVGWAKPVPINPRNFRKPNRDIILVSVAGITVNLILFLIFCFLYAVSFRWILSGAGAWYLYLQEFLIDMISFNLSLAIFNLIPVPPLDGFRLVNQIFFRGNLYLSPQTMQIIHFVFLFICLSGLLSNAFGTVINSIYGAVMQLFINLLY